MSREALMSWAERLLLGAAGLGAGAAMAAYSPAESAPWRGTVAVLFGLAALTGLAKSGTT
jgi:hypothetical protein